MTRAPATLAVLVASTLVAALVAGAPTAAGADDTGTAGARTMLVLDSSGSMKEPAAGGTTKIAAAKQALRQVVGELPAEAEVGLRVFGATVFSRRDRGACTDSQQVVAPGTDNRAALIRAVEGYRPYGETPIGFALRQAARDLGDPRDGAPRSIVLVSDGLATCDPDPCLVARQLRARGVDLRVDVVGLAVDARARSQLRCIAAAGGGSYDDAASSQEIVDRLTTATERALRPFRVDGDVVRGTPTPDGAPALEPGSHADSIGRAGGSRWYSYERRMPGSTVLLSAYVLAPGAFNRLGLRAYDDTGAPCPVVGPRSYVHALFTGYADVVPGDGDRCSGDLRIEVQRTTAGAPTPFGLRVVEVPAVTDAASLPAPATATEPFQVPRRGKPVPVVAGSSFADATELRSGRTYSATVVPGEVNAYKVRVGWGQRLAVRVDRPRRPAALRDSVGLLDYFQLQLMNPMRATIGDRPAGVDDGTEQRMLDRPTRSQVGTLPVRWSQATQGPSLAYLAGDYYVLYGAGFETDRSVEIPYTITVEVQGAETGAPTYADGQVPLPALDGASPAASASPDPATSPTPAPRDPSGDGPGDGGGSSGGALAAVAGGVLAALLALGALVLLRRRSR